VTIRIGRNAPTLIGLGAVVAAALAFTAGIPLTTIFWFGLVLACPLMMLFMHGDHQQGDAPKAPEQTVANKTYRPGVQ